MPDYSEHHERCKTIAKELGPGWAYDTKHSTDASEGTLHPNVILAGPQFGLWIAPPAWAHKGRCEASTDLPRGPKGEYVDWFPYGTKRPSCTWAEGRDAKSAAAHIRRSILAPMAALWPEIERRIGQTFGYHDRLEASINRAYAALGLNRAEHERYGSRPRSLGSHYDGGIEVEPLDGEWKLTISLPVDEAEAFVKAHRARAKAA